MVWTCRAMKSRDRGRRRLQRRFMDIVKEDMERVSVIEGDGRCRVRWR